LSPETIGTGSRLERAAAKSRCAGRLDARAVPSSVPRSRRHTPGDDADMAVATARLPARTTVDSGFTSRLATCKARGSARLLPRPARSPGTGGARRVFHRWRRSRCVRCPGSRGPQPQRFHALTMCVICCIVAPFFITTIMAVDFLVCGFSFGVVEQQKKPGTTQVSALSFGFVVRSTYERPPTLDLGAKVIPKIAVAYEIHRRKFL